MKTILIIKNRSSSGIRYLIDEITDRWIRWGHRVITLYGVNNLPKADIAILHIDKTVVPQEYKAVLSSYMIVLNRQTMDISKRHYSQNIINQNNDYPGKVIVKTDRNFGGAPEATRTTYWLSKITNRWNWAKTEVLNPTKYPIFYTKNDVPKSVWKNKNLIVEKFLPEKENGLFFVRYWIFLGDQGWTGRIGSKNPIVKFSRMVTEDTPVLVPEELIKLRQELGLDYGRIDFTVYEGKAVVLDVNKTIGGAHHVDAYAVQLDQLARGIHQYF